MPAKPKRVIFHVDMDAFYASVEQRDNPSFRGRPVIVGADPKDGLGRGVVAACSYEARRFGVHSALPISRAYRLCPHGVYVRPRMQDYVDVSRKIRTIFREFTPLVEPMSIDEAFLDVSGYAEDDNESIELARRLKKRVFETEALTASVGIAPSKFVAKVASDLEKPDGLVHVPRLGVQHFLDPLPVSKIWGVGPRTEEKLKSMKLHTIGELRSVERGLLASRFGKLGDHLWRLANGIDGREVVTHRGVKSVSQERTFSEDTDSREVLVGVLEKLSEKVSRRLEKRQLAGKTVSLKLRYDDFTTFTRQASFRDAIWDSKSIVSVAVHLLDAHWTERRKVRLIGVGLSSLEDSQSNPQLRLFDQ